MSRCGRLEYASKELTLQIYTAPFLVELSLLLNLLSLRKKLHGLSLSQAVTSKLFSYSSSLP